MFSRSPRGSKSQLKLQCAFWHRCRLTRLPFLLNPNLYHAFALPMHSSSADYSTWLSLLPHIELALPLSFTANCLPLHFFPIKFRPQLQPSSRVILFFNDDSFWSLHHLPKCSTHHFTNLAFWSFVRPPPLPNYYHFSTQNPLSHKSTICVLLTRWLEMKVWRVDS